MSKRYGRWTFKPGLHKGAVIELATQKHVTPVKFLLFQESGARAVGKGGVNR